jgi:two-component system cell cycle sensor histidine kinase PleC
MFKSHTLPSQKGSMDGKPTDEMPVDPAMSWQITPDQKVINAGYLQRTFDYELLRLTAHNRISASLAFALLIITTCIAAYLLLLPKMAAVTTLPIVLVYSLSTVVILHFLRLPAERVDLVAWRRRFIIIELLQGTTWAAFVFVGLQYDMEGTRNFVLVITRLVGAVGVMLGSSMPIAVLAGLAPLVFAILAVVILDATPANIALTMVTGSAQVFFLYMANRLNASVVEIFQNRVEKDALIGELEQAKANSDEARRRAEESNLAKSRFLATMSHELRTPLNAILGFSEVMKGELLGPHHVKAYGEYASDIHVSGEMLPKIINEILDLSRIEAGRYELNEDCVKLADVMVDCSRLLQLRAHARQITIEQISEPDLPPIWADERAIRQIALNILSNGIKFTPPKGNIVIKIGWTTSGGQYVSVRDNGPGIPPEEIPIIMQSFGRGTLAIKTAEQGTGLGLPIVKGLVELHGGNFELVSDVGEGTMAMVMFPASRVMEPALPQMPGQRDRRKAA